MHMNGNCSCGLKYFRDVLGKIAIEKRKKRKVVAAKKSGIQTGGSRKNRNSEASPLVDVPQSSSLSSCVAFLKALCLPNLSAAEHALHLLQTFLHVVQVVVGYLLMLVVMTYNLWLFLAVVLGFGLGYLVFGRLRMVQALTLVEEDPCCN